MRKRLIPALAAGILAAMITLTAVPAETARAAEATEPSLTIDYAVDHLGQRVPVSGATVTVYLAAKADGGVLRLVSPYQGQADMDREPFEGKSASELTSLAKKLSMTSNTPAASGTTDADGYLTFDSLEDGVYLVTETGRTGTAEGYETFDPYFVAIPGADGSLDVTSEPKTKKIEKEESSKPAEPSESSQPSEPSRPSESSGSEQKRGHGETKTGDTTALVPSLVIAGVSLILLGLLLAARKKSGAKRDAQKS